MITQAAAGEGTGEEFFPCKMAVWSVCQNVCLSPCATHQLKQAAGIVLGSQCCLSVACVGLVRLVLALSPTLSSSR